MDCAAVVNLGAVARPNNAGSFKLPALELYPTNQLNGQQNEIVRRSLPMPRINGPFRGRSSAALRCLWHTGSKAL